VTEVQWLQQPEKHDYQAAEDYLSLIMSPSDASGLRDKLAKSTGLVTRKAKDILRASQLALLSQDNKHVADDLSKVKAGTALSPILLIRGHNGVPLTIADGYHRVCASYWVNENTDIPCVLV
jgi:hypothetical protein